VFSFRRWPVTCCKKKSYIYKSPSILCFWAFCNRLMTFYIGHLGFLVFFYFYLLSIFFQLHPLIMVFISFRFFALLYISFFFQFYPLIWVCNLILYFNIRLMVNQFLFFLSYNKRFFCQFFNYILFFVFPIPFFNTRFLITLDFDPFLLFFLILSCIKDFLFNIIF